MPDEPQFHSSYYLIVQAVLRQENPFEQTIEERAAQIVNALPRAEAQEIADLKKELRRAGKAYGRASQTIGYLRRELALARLYRTCWAKAKASDCPACREVFADEPFHSRLPSAEEVAAARRRRMPRSLGIGKNGPPDLSQREGFGETHAAAFTSSGRDTGHALCGSPDGPVSVSTREEDVQCVACWDLLNEDFTA